MSQNPYSAPTSTAGMRCAQAQQLGCADLVDALGRRHRHRAHILGLKSPTPGRILFGPAATIAYFPSCAARSGVTVSNFRSLFREAVGDEPGGKVLVLGANGYPDVSVGGGTKLGRVHHYGLAGVLTDGRLRDFAELRSYDFAAYCAGEAVEAGGALITPRHSNVPVVLHGVGIMPGDYVFADGSGAVVIPGTEIDEILCGAVEVKREDAEFRKQIAQERDTAGDSTRGRLER
ncbi:RraA family protein [Rhodococcus ruber]|uniref:Putative 4-hydroxy-4-methyl-2-oxoglutarate aldolase n=1 Tax=Rhodococcus ruber TaxID=1830 RepID=A0ABT4MJ80_9NOCA|nr:RraA family protein [Rhodococcus ruber]MCZ4521051.1 RraA family protein [Rhodococcus ruber]